MSIRRLAVLAVFAVVALSLSAIPSLAAPVKGRHSTLVKSYSRVIKPTNAARPISPAQVATKATINNQNFDAGLGSWFTFVGEPTTDPIFGVTSYKKYGSSGKSAYCAQAGANSHPNGGPYPNDCDTWLTYGPFNLSTVTAGRITFKLWMDTEAEYDVLSAGWSNDDVSYEMLDWSGSSEGNWITCTVEMDEPSFANTYLGDSSAYFSFRFVSDFSINYEGAYVDNALIATVVAPGVTGAITSGGSPLKGAIVTLSGGRGYGYTNASGVYNVPPSSTGTITVTPKKPGYTFTPTSRSVSFISGTSVTANFTATKATGDGVVRYYGVCVGIAQFQYINDLNYCDDDARDMASVLKAGGWPSANLKMLIDSQATKAAIKSAIATFGAKCDADDVFLFFHSNHGGQGTDQAPLDEADHMDEFLCPYDTNSALSTQISDDELGVWMSALPTSKYVVLLDTCYSGGQVRSAGTGFDFASEITGICRDKVGVKDLNDLNAGVVVTSCLDTELSQESSDLRNGVFAYYLVQGMMNGQADANRNKWFSAEEVFNYSEAPAHAYNPDQTLDIFDGFAGELQFCKLPTLITTSVPARNATNVSRTADLVLTYRWNVAQSNAQNKFMLTISGSSTPVPGAFTWDTPNKVMRFNPTATLAANTLYKVTIKSGLSIGGVITTYTDSFTFRTVGVTAVVAMTATAAETGSGTTAITVNLSSAANVSATICNVAGRTIALLPAQDLPSGMSTLLWDGKNSSGAKVPAGMYLVRLQATDGDGNSTSCLAPLRK